MGNALQNDRATSLLARIETMIPVHHLREPSLLAELSARWCERHRAWHGPNHLLAMLNGLATGRDGEEKDTLLIAALYHDAVYDSRARDNEEASAALLLTHAADPHSRVIAGAVEIILASKWAEPPQTPLVEAFFTLDAWQLSGECPLSERAGYEQAIFREYQWVDWATYKQKRAEFLAGWARKFPAHRRGVDECLELLHAMRPRLAVYPGSFNPFHCGHLSILQQAESVFDKVVIAIGVNRQKPGALESVAPRLAALQSSLRFHEVVSFEGLLTRFVESSPLPLTIVRGVRDGTDLEAELRFTRFLNELRPDTRVVWIACEAELQHLSSNAIRELESIEPGAGRRYIPDTAAIYDFVTAP